MKAPVPSFRVGAAQAGATTATIFVRYLQAVEAKLPQRLATAPYYGIKTGILFFGGETTEANIEAFTYPYSLANHALIRHMERPKLPLRDLDAFAYALRSRTVIGPNFFTHFGIVKREDGLPQFAEFCLYVGSFPSRRPCPGATLTVSWFPCQTRLSGIV